MIRLLRKFKWNGCPGKKRQKCQWLYFKHFGAEARIFRGTNFVCSVILVRHYIISPSPSPSPSPSSPSQSPFPLLSLWQSTWPSPPPPTTTLGTDVSAILDAHINVYENYVFLAATKQLYKWYFPSVRPSVRLSVYHTFLTMFPSSYHHEIFRSYDQSKVHAKGQGHRSKVKVTGVTTQLNRFRTVTPVWIHIWWWNDEYSLMSLRRGALLFFKIISQISRSHGSKNRRIWPRLGVSGL